MSDPDEDRVEINIIVEDGTCRVEHSGTDDLRHIGFYLHMALFQFTSSITGIALPYYDDEDENEDRPGGRHAR